MESDLKISLQENQNLEKIIEIDEFAKPLSTFSECRENEESILINNVLNNDNNSNLNENEKSQDNLIVTNNEENENQTDFNEKEIKGEIPFENNKISETLIDKTEVDANDNKEINVSENKSDTKILIDKNLSNETEPIEKDFGDNIDTESNSVLLEKTNSENLNSNNENESSIDNKESKQDLKSVNDPPVVVKPEFNNPKFETTRMKDYLKKAVKATSQYNKLINQERKDERRICLDLQTYTLHYPLGLGVENRMLKKNVESGVCKQKGKYPIAVLSGHYQNNFRKYTSQELKYFPINTVLYGPVITDTDKLPPLLTRIEEDFYSDSDSASDTSTQHSCCCDEKACKKLKIDNSENIEKCNCDMTSSSEEEMDERPPPLPILMKHFENRPNAICDICRKNNPISIDNTSEKLIHCSDCEISVHPSCLEMSTEMIDVIKTYPWQCMNCKTCVYCSKAYYESNMMFCDKCDRGYHTFCVGLKQIPVGKWVCKLCAICAQCGATAPGKSNKLDWHHETLKINTASGTLRRHQLLCVNCSKLKRGL